MAVEREGIDVAITADVSNFTGPLGSAIGSLTGFRVASAAAAAATAVAFGVQATRTFAAYEVSISNVARKHSLTTEETERLTNRVDAMRESMAGARFSNVQLAAALDSVAQGGRSVDDSLEIVRTGAQLANASNQDLVESTEAINAVLEAYSFEATEAGRVGDVLLTASDVGGVALRDLSGDLVSTMRSARLFGLTFEEQAATVAGLSSKGVDSRQIRSMFGALADLESPASNTSKALLDELSVQAHDASGELRPLKDIITDLNVVLATNGKTVEEDGRLLKAVFGEAGPTLHTYVLATDELTLASQRVSAAQGEMAAAVDQNQAQVTTKMDEAKAKWSDLGAWFGENVIAPTIGPIADSLDPKQFEDMKQQWEDFKASLTLENIILAGFKDTPIGEFFAWIGEMALNVGAWFSGMGAAISSGISSAVSAVGTFLSDIGSALGGFVTSAIQWGKDFISNFVDGLVAGWNALKQSVQNIWEGIEGIFSHDLAANDARAAKWGGDFVKFFAQGMNAQSGLLANAATLQAPNVAGAPSAGGAGTTIVLNGDIVTSASNLESLKAEILGKAARQSEYTARYGSLSYRRGTTG